MENTGGNNKKPLLETGLRLSIMGSEGCGKTCFFAGLAWLGSAARASEFGLIGRNKASQTFVNKLKENIARHEMPQSTHKTDDLALDVICRGIRIGIDIEDFSGEEFRAVGNTLNTDSALFSKLTQSRYLFLFLDIENDVDRNVANNAERLDALLNLLSKEELCDGKRKLAIVLTKSDVHGFIGDDATSSAAREYLKSKKPGLLEKIENLGYKKDFFFLAPIGRQSLEGGLEPVPFGYEALFAWLTTDLILERIKRKILRWWRPLAACAMIIVLAAGYITFKWVERKRSDEIIDDPAASRSDKVTALGNASQDKADTFIDEEIDRISKELDSIDTLEGLSVKQGELSDLNGKGSKQCESRLADLKLKARNMREDMHVDNIKQLVKNKDLSRLREAISKYFLDQDCSKRCKDYVSRVRDWCDEAERINLRDAIRAKVVISGRLDTLQDRCDLIANIKNKLMPDEQKEVERALAIARLFLGDGTYHITIKSAEGVLKSSRTRLVLSNLGPKSVLQQYETSHQDSRNPQWNKKIDFRWKPGDSIKVEWLWQCGDLFLSTTIGQKTFSDPWTSLLDALGGVELKPETGAFHARLEECPRATIVCDEYPNPREDLRLFQKYIVPGTYW